MTEDNDKNPSPDKTTEEAISPAPLAGSMSDPLIGTKIGSCTLKRIIGSGGMGIVYEAMQEQPRRRVALKMMKRGITSRSATRRFEFESQTLARLKHVGVAQIYEAGTHDDGSGGVPYFVMEYIPNAKSITDYANGKKLGTRDRLKMFSNVCDAVQHGHLKGIVHRDLKPGNILVDSSGQPKVIDFGVARSTDSDLAVTTLQTDVGQLIGTLQYMSPEQCDADPSDIDARSDVYALGVILYELLTGKPPYNLQRLAIHEAVRIVREEEPTKLSTFDRHLRGDVETISLKALEKDRDRRYQSATELDQDIQRYLSDEPISARAPGAIDYLRRFAKRYKAAAIAIVAIFMVMVSATIVTSVYVVVAWEMQDKAQAAVEVAEKEKETASELVGALALQNYYSNIRIAKSALNKGDLLSARRRLDEARDNFFHWYMFSLSPGEAPDVIEVNPLLLYEWKYLSAQCDDSAQTLFASSYVKEDTQSWWSGIAYSPDGSSIAMVDRTGFGIQIIDVKSGDFLYELKTDKSTLSTGVGAITFSPDGKLLAHNGRFQEDKVVLWDLESAEHQVFDSETGYSQMSMMVLPIAFSPDGAHLASGTQGGVVHIWDVTNGEEIATLQTAAPLEYLAITGIDYSSDGSIIVTSGFGVIELWDTKTWSNIGYARVGSSIINLRTGKKGTQVEDVSINTSGDLIATTGDDIHLWSVPLMKATKMVETYSQSLAPEADLREEFLERYGSELSEAERDLVEEVSLPDTQQFKLLELEFQSLISESGLLREMDFWNVSGDWDFWNFSSQWNSLNSAEPSGGLRALTEPVLTIQGDWNTSTSISFSPDDTLLMATTKDGVGANSPGSIRLWDLERNKYGVKNSVTRGLPDIGDKPIKLSGHETPVIRGIFSPDGKVVASYGGKQLLKIWEATGNASIESMLNRSGVFTSFIEKLSISPDGTLLAVPFPPYVHIIDIESRSLITTLNNDYAMPSHTLSKSDAEIRNMTSQALSSTAFSPDGKHIAAGVNDGSIKIWNLDSGYSNSIHVDEDQHRISVMSNIVLYSPDGSLIASADGCNSVHLFDVETGQEAAALEPVHSEFMDDLFAERDDLIDVAVSLNLTAYPRDIAFSPDGQYLAVAYHVGSFTGNISGDWVSIPLNLGVRFWNMDTMKPVTRFNKHLEAQHLSAMADKSSISVAWSPNGKTFASGTRGGEITVLDLESGEFIWKATEHDGGVLDLKFSNDGKRIASCGEDHTINLWTASTGELLMTLLAHEQPVESVVFSPDDSLLISSGGLDSVRFWDTRSHGKVANTKRLVLEGMDQLIPVVDEWFDVSNGDTELVMAMLDRAEMSRPSYETKILKNLVLGRLLGQPEDIETFLATVPQEEQQEAREALGEFATMDLQELQQTLAFIESGEPTEEQKPMFNFVRNELLKLIEAKGGATPK